MFICQSFLFFSLVIESISLLLLDQLFVHFLTLLAFHLLSGFLEVNVLHLNLRDFSLSSNVEPSDLLQVGIDVVTAVHVVLVGPLDLEEALATTGALALLRTGDEDVVHALGERVHPLEWIPVDVSSSCRRDMLCLLV